MQKLLDKFAADPTKANAQRVVRYGNRHPMWPVTAGGERNMKLWQAAQRMAGRVN